MVKDILSMREIASQATLHKELTNLVDQGYLSLLSDPVDLRAKKIVMTKKGNDLVAKLSKLLSNSTALD